MRSPIVPEVILVEGQLTSSSGVMQPPTSAPAITIPWPGHDLGTANNIDNVSNVVTSVINLDEVNLEICSSFCIYDLLIIFDSSVEKFLFYLYFHSLYGPEFRQHLTPSL